jgi:predicted nucleic acid-binding protein
MIVVSDTSVITSLIHIGREQLLQELHGAVLIPPAVHQELLRTHVRIPAFLEVRHVNDHALVARLKAELDLGEAEAIVLAKETKADLLLIDEKIGRQVAVREGLRISGLLGLCVDARRIGKIVSLRELVQRLELEAGFRVSRAVKEQAFILAGE